MFDRKGIPNQMISTCCPENLIEVGPNQRKWSQIQRGGKRAKEGKQGASGRYQKKGRASFRITGQTGPWIEQAS